MTQPRIRTTLLAFALAVGAPAAAMAQTAAPQAEAPLTDPAAKQIQGFYDALIASMKSAKTTDVKGRYKKLEPAVDAAFDFPDMTRMTVGPQWDTMSSADQAALTNAFRRMTIADYAHNFDGYNGESFEVSPTVQERSGDKIVSSKMVVPNQQPIPFVYRMHQTAKGWQIIDIFLNGYVSEVATRRADFASTLKSGGAKALVEKLNALTDKTLSGK